MSQLIFSALLLLLSLSDQGANIGADLPMPQAQEFWIVSPATGVTVWVRPTGIVYEEGR